MANHSLFDDCDWNKEENDTPKIKVSVNPKIINKDRQAQAQIEAQAQLQEQLQAQLQAQRERQEQFEAQVQVQLQKIFHLVVNL